MRPGVESLTPAEDDSFLLQFGALIINGVSQQSGPWLGKCEYTLVSYEKATQVSMKLNGEYLSFTVDKGVSHNEIVEIVNSIQAIRVSH